MPNLEQSNEPQDTLEVERRNALFALARTHLEPEDVDDLQNLYETDEERLDYVYGRLLEQGEDPDAILRGYGVTEAEGEV